ncbi:MAG: hypothetical protein WCC92_17740 [Candidatus Korobacteraceae bacterium]
MQDFEGKLQETREILVNALNEGSFAKIRERIKRAGKSGDFSKNTVRSIVLTPTSSSRSQVLRACCGPALLQEPIPGVSLQRYLLVETALSNLDKLRSLSVYPTVKRLICDEFQFLANPPERDVNLFEASGHPFFSFCKIALLERFPAGQYHWEISGFPRSWILKVPKMSVLPILYFITTKMKGFAPYMEPHMPTRPPSSMLILEKQSDKAWYRMARSIEMNTAIKGLVAFSWFHSPDTFRISPHLSFINKPFVESGAVITTIGRAADDSGFLTGSTERQKLFESGEFKPMQGVILWSRAQMINWARSHPELDDR